MPDSAGNKQTVRLSNPRVSEEERAVIQYLASLANLTVAEYIRQLCMSNAKANVKYFLRGERLEALKKLLDACGEEHE